MNTIALIPLSENTTSPPTQRNAERDDLRKRLIQLIADREAAKHIDRKEIRGK